MDAEVWANGTFSGQEGSTTDLAVCEDETTEHQATENYSQAVKFNKIFPAEFKTFLGFMTPFFPSNIFFLERECLYYACLNIVFQKQIISKITHF